MGDFNSRKSEWSTWRNMWQRCTNPKVKEYQWYGARGITICERWKDFANFLADMGPKPTPLYTIERKDNNGNYEPDNCRWATKSEQAENQRTTIRITLGGITHSMSWWCRHFKIDRETASRRFKRLGDWEKVFTMDGRLPRSNSMTLTIDGVTKTLKEFAADHDVSPRVVWQRMFRDGLDAKQALTKGSDYLTKKNVIRITIGGVTDSLNGWCKRTGIPRTTAARRFKKHGDWAKVFTVDT